MNIENYIIIAVLLTITALIVLYLYKAKKRGSTCIGCPNAKECRGKCNGNCNKNDSGTDSRS